MARALVAVACSAVLLAGCTEPQPTIAVTPLCSLLAVVLTTDTNRFGVVTRHATPYVSERTDPSTGHGFKRFRRIAGPYGNAAAGSRSADVYGISEAWVRNQPPVVLRAQAHPARRPATGDFDGSAWSIQSQNATGAWSPVSATGSANPGNEQDDAAAGGMTVPQLMEVGNANREVFACAGGRSDDDAVRTTVLLEVSTSGSAVPVQDLLNGDDRFVPNAPGPLIGPADPPTPTISNRPGKPVRDGSVQCAMTQLGDDVATRELHMLTISSGVLYHSTASNFSPATTGLGATFMRFNSVSAWGDVSQALGGGFGTIVAAAVVASRPHAISVFFVAESGGRYRLFHAVRFSPSGAWRAADDVLLLNGGTMTGTSFPLKVAAGMCPVLERPGQSEIVYAIWDADTQVHVGRVVSIPRQWEPGLTGIYAPLSNVGRFWSGSAAQQATIQNLVIGTRPFSDDARPSP